MLNTFFSGLFSLNTLNWLLYAVECLCRVIWREKCGAWPLIPIFLSVPPLVMTRPCAYGTSRPATACSLYANSEKVSRRSGRWACFLTGSAVIPGLQQTHYPPQAAVAAASPLMVKPWQLAWMTAASLLWTQTPWRTWCPSTTARTSSRISDSLQVCGSPLHFLQNSPQILVWEVNGSLKPVCPSKRLSVCRMLCRSSAGIHISFPLWLGETLLQVWPKLMAFCNRARQGDSKSRIGNSRGEQSESRKLNSLSPGHLTLILNASDPISQPNAHEPTS